MSDGEKKVDLGDLLAAGYVLPPFAPEQKSADDAERFLVNLATVAHLDPSEVLEEYRRGGALARLLKVLFSFGDRPSRFWAAYDAVEAVRAEGLKGQRAFAKAVEHLNEKRDALGRSEGAISIDSVRQYHKEGGALLRKQARSLSYLFVPNDDRPPRRSEQKG